MTTGFIPKIHMSDINIKNPALKFKENQRVKAKVLTVDPSRRRLTLTLKRSVIKNRFISHYIFQFSKPT